jgi:hypothetical protein
MADVIHADSRGLGAGRQIGLDKPTVPDIEVRVSCQDFCENSDPVIVKALEVLNSNQ